MATALYADVHVPGPVILQLRLRGVNIAAANEEGHERSVAAKRGMSPTKAVRKAARDAHCSESRARIMPLSP